MHFCSTSLQARKEARTPRCFLVVFHMPHKQTVLSSESHGFFMRGALDLVRFAFDPPFPAFEVCADSARFRLWFGSLHRACSLLWLSERQSCCALKGDA